MNSCWLGFGPVKASGEIPGRPVIELGLWEGLKGEGSQGPAGVTDSQRQFASQLLGLVLGSDARDYSTLFHSLMGRGRKPTAVTSSAPLTTPLYSPPPAPSHLPRPCHTSPAAAGEAAPTPTLPGLLPSSRLELAQESGSPGWDLLSSSRAKAFTFSWFVSAFGLRVLGDSRRCGGQRGHGASGAWAHSPAALPSACSPGALFPRPCCPWEGSYSRGC